MDYDSNNVNKRRMVRHRKRGKEVERGKLLEPALPARLEAAERPEELVDMALARGDALTGWQIVGADLSGVDMTELEVQGCLFQGCRFTGANWHGARFADVVFRNCECSAVQAEDADFCRCRIENVKAVAASFAGSRLAHVRLEDSCLRQANLTGALLQQVYLHRSDLSEAFLAQCRHKGLVLRECTLMGTSFFGTLMNGLDFTDCRMEGIVVSDAGKELRGAIVNVSQAADLARVLGLVIR